MARKRVDLLDPKTGEIQQGYIVWVGERPNRLVGGRFFMVFQDAMLMLARDPELTQQVQRVMLYLFGSLDFDNFIHIKQKEIAEALNMDKGNVSKAVSLLKRKGIILEAPYKGVRCYKLNHFYGWKGSVTSLKKQDNKPKLTLVKSE